MTGLFDAAVSAPRNPVSRKQRPTVAETRHPVGLALFQAVGSLLLLDFVVLGQSQRARRSAATIPRSAQSVLRQ